MSLLIKFHLDSFNFQHKIQALFLDINLDHDPDKSRNIFTNVHIYNLAVEI